MADGAAEQHRLAGFDDRERGFNRPVECEPCAHGFRAVLRYETLRVTAEHPVSPREAVESLVQRLQQQGYRELRSQLSFKDGAYLGSQEPWVEYPDPPRGRRTAGGPWAAVLDWMKRLLHRYPPPSS